MGVLQIGIRAWLQHLAFLGSWTSCTGTPSKVLLKKGVALYPNPHYQKLKLRMKISYCVYAFERYELCADCE